MMLLGWAGHYCSDETKSFMMGRFLGRNLLGVNMLA